MPRDDAAYIHLQDCITSLNNAWTIICKLQEAPDSGLITWAAYRFAIIEYAKPFKVSQGLRRRHVLKSIEFDAKQAGLHQHAMKLRDKVLAHSDLDLLDAQLHVGQIAGQPVPMVISNMEPAMPPLADMRGLVEAVLRQLYERAARAKQEFGGATDP